jgi:hypothetical protein
MIEVTYTLTVRAPAVIDRDDLVVIDDEADAQDTTLPLRVARWLGGAVQHAKDALNDQLPEGWNVAVAFVSAEGSVVDARDFDYVESRLLTPLLAPSYAALEAAERLRQMGQDALAHELEVSLEEFVGRCRRVRRDLTDLRAGAR